MGIYHLVYIECYIMPEHIDYINKKPTYPQNWRAYNSAQVGEKEYFLKLLSELCFKSNRSVPRQIRGRPRLSLNEMIFAVCFKTYSTMSGRRFMTDLRDIKEKGFISAVPHFNSLFNYLDDPYLTPILKEMIIQSSLPFTAIENVFAVDSSGFTTRTYARWYDHKYGEKPRHEWVKAHIVCGVKTHTITAVEIWEQHTHDSQPFADLIKTTSENFEIKEISGDKAYSNYSNMEIAEKVGAVPYLMFKVSASMGKESNNIWRKMFHYFHLNQEQFLKRYHLRSNVETTFSMIKGKFGGSVRGKTITSRTNETLCKMLCHNICVFIHEMHEMGMEVEFNQFIGMPKSPFY